MKLFITVTDDHGTGSSETMNIGEVEVGAASGPTTQTVFDGGPVPEALLSMASEVAAGYRPHPGQSS